MGFKSEKDHEAVFIKVIEFYSSRVQAVYLGMAYGLPDHGLVTGFQADLFCHLLLYVQASYDISVSSYGFISIVLLNKR